MLGLTISRDFAEKIAKYEYLLHLNLYPTYADTQSLPGLSELLLSHRVSLKKLEVSFTYIGLFLIRDDVFEKTLEKVKKSYVSRMEKFAEFYLFYDAIILRKHRWGVLLKRCFIYLFWCRKQQPEIEQLKQKHQARLSADELLDEFNVMDAALLSEYRQHIRIQDRIVNASSSRRVQLNQTRPGEAMELSLMGSDGQLHCYHRQEVSVAIMLFKLL